jgi:hypothetical protein
VVTRFNSAPVTVDRTDGAAYKDISPRVGMALDVFGTGKTALKFNFGRYLAPATNDTGYTVNNPASRIVSTITNRSWSDTNGNLVVDCDILNPAQQTVPGGDSCGALTGNNLNFGRVGSPGTRVNPATLTGWSIRPDDWQWGVNLQQELIPRVSLEVGYNRRWWGHFTVTDNLLVAPSDYEKWVITAPRDSRLPDGGGYPVAVYTMTAAAAARGADNYVTFETDYGPARTQYWHGVDVTLNARTRQSLTLQGGTTTGRKITDTCATSILLDDPDSRNCRSVDPFETTLRGLASYMVPGAGVLVSATIRSQPAQQLGGGIIGNGATYNVPNTVVQTLLGRLPPGGLANGNTTVRLIDNGDRRLYAPIRRTQLDMRFAKIIRFSGRRVDIGVDLQNLLNTNYALTYVSQYDYANANGGTWFNPTTILGPRFARLNLTFDF